MIPSKDDLRRLIFHLALDNASKFGGKTSPGIVMGHLIARVPDLRERTKELIPIVEDICERVNSMSIAEISRNLAELGVLPEMQIIRKEVRSKLDLPQNPEIEGYVLRFAPNPDGPLTLGNARPALLCDYFCNKYGGKFILRFEDTSPSVKPPILDAYEWIIEDLKWLGVKIDEIYYQSDRLELYYNYGEKLLLMGGAYVCTCQPEVFKDFIKVGKACQHRESSVDKNIALWEKMLNGEFKQGEAVVRVKTSLFHPNPALRDWPALRIDDAPHPRVSTRYHVWPLYNWACAIDDHEMGITHVIRAKEHLTNQIRQSFVFDCFQWKKPLTITIGRVKLEGSVLSKSKIMQGLRMGNYIGLDDPRLGTIKTARKRGIRPEVIREAILDLGIKPVEATLKWENLSSANRALIDRVTPRLFFVESPLLMKVKGVRSDLQDVDLPNHPDNKELGVRRVPLEITNGVLELYVSSSDIASIDEGEEIRLMGLFNVRVNRKEPESIYADFLSISLAEAEVLGMRFIQWVPIHFSVPTKILMPHAELVWGMSERNAISYQPGQIVQYVRFGFVRLERVENDYIEAIFAHR